jgi:hypothetical protein
MHIQPKEILRMTKTPIQFFTALLASIKSLPMQSQQLSRKVEARMPLRFYVVAESPLQMALHSMCFELSEMSK